MITIYGIADPDTMDIFYVGRTSDFKQRQYQHLTNSHSKGVRIKINTLLGLGKSPVFIILEECEDGFCETEKKWINHFNKLGNNLYNNIPIEKPGVVTFYIEETLLRRMDRICKRESRSFRMQLEYWIKKDAKRLNIEIAKPAKP